MKFGCFFNRIKRICKYYEEVSISPYIFSIKVFRLVRLRPIDLFKEVHIASGRGSHGAQVISAAESSLAFAGMCIKKF